MPNSAQICPRQSRPESEGQVSPISKGSVWISGFPWEFVRIGNFPLVIDAFAWLDALRMIVQVELIFMGGLASGLLLIPLWIL